MVVVAIAGGTGKIGRTIVEAIVDTRKHSVLVLARKANPALEAELGVPVVEVDYANVQAVTRTLEENEVDTVISAMSMLPGPAGEAPKEIELIRGADASKTTKRMISSDWGIPRSPKQAHHTPYDVSLLPSAVYKERAQDELKNVQSLKTTYVKNGYFMDYWGIPGVKSHFEPVSMFVDIRNQAAAIPGDGNMPIVMTHTTDIAKLVAASLDLEEWDPVLYTVGDKVTMNDLLHFAEEAKGKKFSVTYDSLEMLRSGSSTELPGDVAGYSYMSKKKFRGLVSAFGLWFAEGVLNYTPLKTLNQDFPKIKPIKVKDMIYQAWEKN